MEEATYVACVGVAIELFWRVSHCQNLSLFISAQFSITTSGLFIISYCLCMLAIIMDLRSLDFFKSTYIRESISWLHAIDGVSALLLGLALYYHNSLLVILGVLCLTKCFLLSMLSRMVTGIKSLTAFELCVQSTKTFLHHLGSFLFVSNSTVILITAVWRCVSMNGHAILAMKHSLPESTFNLWMWRIAHLRNAMIVIVCLCCAYSEEIRRGFAVSAIGHVAYMLVRLGPVFRLGSHYLDDEIDKKRWGTLTDKQRLIELVYLRKYPFFALELWLLLMTSLFFIYLRLTTDVHVDEQSCMFS